MTLGMQLGAKSLQPCPDVVRATRTGHCDQHIPTAGHDRTRIRTTRAFLATAKQQIQEQRLLWTGLTSNIRKLLQACRQLPEQVSLLRGSEREHSHAIH